MATTTLKIVLYTSNTLRNGYHQIKLRVIHDRKVRYIGLGEYCHPLHWNSDKAWIASNHPNFDELDLLLKEKISKASKALLHLRNQKEYYGIEDVMEALSQNESTQTLSSFYKVVIERLKKAKKEGSMKWHSDALQFLERNNGGKPLTWTRISVYWLKELEATHLGAGYSLNGLSVYYRSLRSVINQATNEGIYQGESPFKRYQIKHSKAHKRSLSVKALHTINNLDLTKHPTLHKYRQLFMLMFYLQGINFIDLASLKISDIQDDRLVYRRRKIGKPMSILLSDEAKAIIGELALKAHPPFLLPILNPNSSSPMPNQERYHRKRFNKKLSLVADKAKIAHFTGYSARHCWASMANEGQIPITTIAQALGHSSVKTTQIYLDELSNAVADQASRKITELFNQGKEKLGL